MGHNTMAPRGLNAKLPAFDSHTACGVKLQLLASFFLSFFLCSSIGGVAYGTVFNSSYTWAATFRLRGGTCACWLFLCFHNPLNSDMDYRIFNVRRWSFVCVRIHTGVGHTGTESEPAQPF